MSTAEIWRRDTIRELLYLVAELGDYEGALEAAYEQLDDAALQLLRLALGAQQRAAWDGKMDRIEALVNERYKPHD